MEYDAIIIGTGQAGSPLALRMAKEGKTVAIIEKDHIGGSCVNVGCTPTKAYVASARSAYIAKNSSQLGVSVKGEVQVDLSKIKKRKDEMVRESRENLSKSFEEESNIDLIFGSASFVDPHRIKVNDDIISGKKIFINTGRKPNIPDGFKDVEYLTNRSILELEEIPEHLIVVGGGYAGLEFGQMFRRFGSEVTILDRGKSLIKKEDSEFSEAIAEILNKEGINLRLEAECISAKEENGKIQVQVNCKNGSPIVEGTHLLLATGRRPNTTELDLGKAGIATDEKNYIEVNDQLQTNVDHIYALGTCNGQGAFTHTSYHDYQVVWSHLFQEKKRNLRDRILCYAVFTDPPLARIGMNEKDIRKNGIKARLATRPMTKVARAKEMGETDGLLKIFIEEESDKILGATFLGVRADEVIHSLLDLMYAGAPYTTIRDAVHIHPTVSELIPTMLEDLQPLE